MKITAYFCAAFLAAFTLLSYFPVHGEEEIYENILRLHVIAASDSADDQAEKLRVRDAVLACLDETLAGASDFGAAKADVTAMLGAVKACAAAVTDYPVTVTLGTEHYPVREYENYSLPAGEYTSLRVILGEGEGQNWWCVLFPKLCTAYATSDTFYDDFIAAGFSPEQYHLIKNESSTKYKIRFRILELLSGLWTPAE